MSSNQELSMGSYAGIVIGLMIIVGIEVVLTYQHLPMRTLALLFARPGLCGSVCRHYVLNAREVREPAFVLDDISRHALRAGAPELLMAGRVPHGEDESGEMTRVWAPLTAPKEIE